MRRPTLGTHQPAGSTKTPLFDLHEHRRLRVVLDPRISSPLDELLGQMLADHRVEVGSVGRAASTATVRVVTTNDESVHFEHADAIYYCPSANIRGYAAARAQALNIDRQDLEDGLLYTEAATVWEADIFITDVASLLLEDGRQYTRTVEILSPSEATELIALYLRFRGTYYAAPRLSEYSFNGHPVLWLFYSHASHDLVGGLERPVVSTPDLRFLYEEDFGDGVQERLARALRARDRVMTACLSANGNEAAETTLYELESCFLQLGRCPRLGGVAN